jgi:hypothetical protein
VTVLASEVGTGYVATGEKPPQAALLYDSVAFRVPSNVNQMTVTVHAVSPPAVSPPGRILGNVYSITATADGRSIQVRPDHARVSLRSPSSFGSTAIEEFSGGRWTRLHSYSAFFEPTWTAQVNSLGDFALVIKGQASATTQSQSNRWQLLGIAILALVLVSAALIVLRRGRFRAI